MRIVNRAERNPGQAQRPIHLAYQSPASSTFLSEQTSHPGTERVGGLAGAMPHGSIFFTLKTL
jgi:hypothetical protein